MLLSCDAFVARAGFPKAIVRIEASVMTIAPEELDGIAAYSLIFHGIDIHRDSVRIQLTLVRPLTNAGSAMAFKPKVPVGVGA